MIKELSKCNLMCFQMTYSTVLASEHYSVKNSLIKAELLLLMTDLFWTHISAYETEEQVHRGWAMLMGRNSEIKLHGREESSAGFNVAKKALWESQPNSGCLWPFYEAVG